MLEHDGRAYIAVHIRSEYRQAFADITKLYDDGTREFDTPPDDTDEDAATNDAAAANGIEDVEMVDDNIAPVSSELAS